MRSGGQLLGVEYDTSLKEALYYSSEVALQTTSTQTTQSSLVYLIRCTTLEVRARTPFLENSPNVDSLEF